MNKIILLLIVMTIGLCAQADYMVESYQPSNQGQATWAISQPYQQPFNNNGYYQNPYSQNQYYQNPYAQNPYQTQCQVPNVNPYLYRNRNGYINPSTIINPITSNLNTTGGTSQIVKNIGQSMIYSMLRGY